MGARDEDGAAPPFLSPRIAGLQRRLARGDAAALTAFWRRVQAEGTPLVERLEGSDSHVLVTFLWRGQPGRSDEARVGTGLGTSAGSSPGGGDGTTPGAGVRRVAVFADWVGNELHRHLMAHVPGTDVWHATYRLPRDSRFEYRLSPNDPLIPFYDLDEAQRPQRAAFLQLDPLNTRPFPGPPETPWASAAALPGAPPNPWLETRAGVPAGTVRRHRFTSTILGNWRYVWVYTPPTTSDEPLGLLVLFDGAAYQSQAVAPVATILDNLAAEGRAPPLVAVLVDAISGEDRLRELSCFQPFLDCLTGELLPWVRREYPGRVTEDPARTIVGGSSAGGEAAAFAALRRPDVFGNVLSLSGGFMWMPGYFDAWRRRWRDPVEEGEFGWLIREYVEAPRLPVRFSLAVGTFEFMSPPGVPSILESNRRMRDVLRAKGYDVAYAEYNGGHDYFSWRWALPESLAALTAAMPK